MLWLLAIVSIVSFAQNTTEHLKFMGIPINGTITQFQSKLLAKGCTLNKSTSSTLAIGCRAFKGNFVGNKVDIYVYYDEKTKIVYRTKAVVSGVSKNLSDQVYSDISNMLLQKYGKTWRFENNNNDGEGISIFVPSNDFNPLNIDPYADIAHSPALYGFTGEIDLYISKNDYLIYPYYYCVHADYTDAINNDKHLTQSLEDL